jgi:hypothetical protein
MFHVHKQISAGGSSFCVDVNRPSHLLSEEERPFTLLWAGFGSGRSRPKLVSGAAKDDCHLK